MYILGIETSCDETAAAVVQDGVRILSNVVASQVKYHKKFGGVVPEIASRKHVENICWVVEEAVVGAGLELGQVEAVAVTAGPGLVGALLVGVSVAKSLAYALGIPLIACHHLEGHIYALAAEGQPLPHPAVALIVSGGHTSLYLINGHGQYRLLGRTRDDAVGEAFDKVAKMLGLGYPGGPIIDELARSGDPKAVDFPRAYLEKGSLDFSLSGIKTAVWYYLKQQGIDPTRVPDRVNDIAASFQQAVVEVLVDKTVLAAQRQRVEHILLTGGVACNSSLRRQMEQAAETEGLRLHYPSPALCTDNGAMIASAGYWRYLQGKKANWALTACSNWQL
jgi:N6-L-threonylcarbamoyladenine synthase